MSVDIGFYGLKWDNFLAANESAESTESLLAEHPEEIEAEITPVEFNGSYDSALDASMYYDAIRDQLPEDQRDALDEFLAGCFWVSDDVPMEEIPALAGRDSFRLYDPAVKGERIYLGSLLSADTVTRLASLWNTIDRDAVREAADSAIESDEWGESFNSADEFSAYLEQWGTAITTAASLGVGAYTWIG